MINAWLAPLPAILKRRVHCVPTIDQLQLTPERLARAPERYTKLFEYFASMRAKPALETVVISAQNKVQFRALQQWLGGYLVAVFGGIWYEELIRRIIASEDIELATVGGVRFPSDAATLRKIGGKIIAVLRPLSTEQDSNDLTERNRQAIQPDSLVYNDGSLNQLKLCSRQIFTDLAAQRLQKEYKATDF